MLGFSFFFCIWQLLIYPLLLWIRRLQAFRGVVILTCYAIGSCVVLGVIMPAENLRTKYGVAVKAVNLKLLSWENHINYFMYP